MSDVPPGDGSDSATPPEHALGPWQEVEFRTVTDARAGRLLSDPDWIRYLEPFLGRASGIAEAARAIGRPLDAVRYRVRRMHEAGLLEVVAERRRAGRPVRLYRAVADGFVVPFEATPFADLEERLTEAIAADGRRFARSAARALRAGGFEGRRIYRAPDGSVHQEAAAAADPVESLSLEARLPRSAARRLLQEMIALARRAEELEVAPGDDAHGPVRRYRIGLQIVPLADDD